MRLFTLLFIIALSSIQVSYAQFSNADSVISKIEITTNMSIKTISESKQYNPGIFRNDSLIFFEYTIIAIDTLTKDTSINEKTITYIGKAEDCGKLIDQYQSLKTDNFYKSYTENIRQKPTVKKHPYEGMIFIELLKYQGEYLISPEVWSAIWFNNKYLFQSCSNCEGQCISIQNYIKESTTFEKLSGYSIYSKEDNYVEDISIKLIDPLRKIYVTKIYYFGKNGRPIINYYTPLAEICNFRHLHNRSWDVKTNQDNMPMMYNLEFEEPKWE
jgi:hypothetical protein